MRSCATYLFHITIIYRDYVFNSGPKPRTSHVHR